MTRNEQTNSGKPLKYRMLKLLWGTLPILAFLLVIVVLGYMVGTKSKALETERKAALKKSDSSVNVVTMEMKPKSIRDRINLPGVVSYRVVSHSLPPLMVVTGGIYLCHVSVCLVVRLLRPRLDAPVVNAAVGYHPSVTVALHAFRICRWIKKGGKRK